MLVSPFTFLLWRPFLAADLAATPTSGLRVVSDDAHPFGLGAASPERRLEPMSGDDETTGGSNGMSAAGGELAVAGQDSGFGRTAAARFASGIEDTGRRSAA
jgi:hypothetical protein